MQDFPTFNQWYEKKGYGTAEALMDLLTVPILPFIWLFTGGKSFYHMKQLSYANQYTSERDGFYRDLQRVNYEQ